MEEPGVAAEQDGDWDDWDEETETAAATPAAPATAAICGAKDAEPTADWDWDMAALEANAVRIEEASAGTFSAAIARSVTTACGEHGGGPIDDSDERAQLLQLAVAAPAAHESLQAGRKKAEGLLVLAKVAKLHLLAIRGDLAALSAGETDTGDSCERAVRQIDGEVAALALDLRSEAGNWATSISAWTREDSKKLEEMAGALQHSLRASGDDQDLTLFQQVAEQIFASLPDRTLRVSVEWIHPVSDSGVSKKTAKEEKKAGKPSQRDAAGGRRYLSQLLDMIADGEDASEGDAATAEAAHGPTRVPVLSDAEIFQDAKDIARDELVVNGEAVAGSIGYDAIVDRIQTQLELLLAAEAGKPPQQLSMQLSDTLHRIAMEVLNASNRTESGGSAYEVLGRFLTNHEMDRVLIRPASAKAPPIRIDMDMGAFVAAEGIGSPSDASSWCFGVRVTLTAVTWYLVCDAADPTVELYEVKTTYRNRLAFPVGLTPFHPINHMRKDHGAVDLMLTPPALSPTGPQTRQIEEGEGKKEDEEEKEKEEEEKESSMAVAFDELL